MIFKTKINWINQEIQILDYNGESVFEEGVFLKRDGEWVEKVGDVIFNISNMNYYDGLKKFLDNEYRIYLRKIKLENINNNCL